MTGLIEEIARALYADFMERMYALEGREWEEWEQPLPDSWRELEAEWYERNYKEQEQEFTSQARAALSVILKRLEKPDDKIVSEAYGYTDFDLPEACGGGTREGCVAELKMAYKYILSRHLAKGGTGGQEDEGMGRKE